MADRNVTLKVGYTNEEWDTFVKGKLLLFMTENDIEKIQVDDGCGKKGKIAKNANGEFKVSITSNDTL